MQLFALASLVLVLFASAQAACSDAQSCGECYPSGSCVWCQVGDDGTCLDAASAGSCPGSIPDNETVCEPNCQDFFTCGECTDNTTTAPLDCSWCNAPGGHVCATAGACAAQTGSVVPCSDAGCRKIYPAPTGGALGTCATALASGGSCDYTCDPGHVREGTSPGCSSGDYSPLPSAQYCTEVCLNAPAAPGNGTVAFSDADFDGSVATFSCNSGYTLQDGSSVTCEVANGDWPVANATCVDTDGCVGNLCVDDGDTGATCTDDPPPSTSYTCECTSGYNDVGGTCSMVPTCTSPPAGPAGGSVSFSDGNLDGSVASFACTPGHAFSGTAAVTCSAPGVWPVPPAAPTCTPTECSNAPSPPANGSVAFSAGDGHGSVATFSCSPGFTLSGTPAVTCSAPSANASWPDANATCTDTDACAAGSTCQDDGDATANCVDLPPPSTAYTCVCTGPDYVLSGLRCVDATTPPPPPPPPTCSGTPPAAPTNGNVTITTSATVATASFACNAGYALSSSASITCNMPGSWPATAPPTCTDADACAAFPCHPNADCQDMVPPAPLAPEGRLCACQPGYTGNGEVCQSNGSDAVDGGEGGGADGGLFDGNGFLFVVGGGGFCCCTLMAMAFLALRRPKAPRSDLYEFSNMSQDNFVASEGTGVLDRF